MSATVHVWTIDLDESPATISMLLESLSGEERSRAARLRTTQLRLRFIVAHGALRSILSRYIGIAPERLTLDATPAGKPFVRDWPISFNLAQSDGLAVCAITSSGQLGVDVERLRRVEDADSLVKRYFAPGELRQYAAIRPAERTAAFFSTWTRKEAFVKASGATAADLTSFEVEVSPSAVRPWLATDAHERSEEWSLRAFSPRPQHVAALAIDREIEGLEFFEWSSAREDDAPSAFAGR